MEQHTGTIIPETGCPQGEEDGKTKVVAAERFGFSGPRIYVGPNVAKKGLRFGMGFRGGLTKNVLEMCEACPLLFELIVPPSEVITARTELTVKGSRKYQAMLTFEKYLKAIKAVK